MTLALLWIGGCLASLPLLLTSHAANGRWPDWWRLGTIAIWPILVAALAIDVLKGWRP